MRLKVLNEVIALFPSSPDLSYFDIRLEMQMPKIATFLTLDIGSALGPFFFTLAFNILFPTIVVSLVYEKEVLSFYFEKNSFMQQEK
jgi:hypothetical protein